MRAVVGIALAVVIVAWMSPILLATMAALRTPLAIQQAPSTIGIHAVTSRALVAFFGQGRSLWVANSLEIGLVSLVVTVLCSVPLAYSVVCVPSRLGSVVLRSTMLAFVVPAPFLAIPLLDVVTHLGIAHRGIVTALSVSAVAIPACTWIIAQGIQQVPRQLLDSAAVDRIRTALLVRRVIIPAVLPSAVACAMLAFALGWGESTLAATLILDRNDLPLAAAMPLLLGGDIWRWDLILPAVFVMTVPPIVVSLAFARVLRKHL